MTWSFTTLIKVVFIGWQEVDVMYDVTVVSTNTPGNQETSVDQQSAVELGW